MAFGRLKKLLKPSSEGTTENTPSEGGPSGSGVSSQDPGADGGGQPASSPGGVSDGATLGGTASPPEAPADPLSVGPALSPGAAPDTTVSPADAAADGLGLGDSDSSSDDLMGLFEEEDGTNEALRQLSEFLEDVDIHILVEEGHQILAGLRQRDHGEGAGPAGPI